MLRTFFVLPHALFGIPVFGIGWIFGILLLLGIGYAIWSFKKPEGKMGIVEKLPTWGIAMALVAVVAPRIEIFDVNHRPLGLALRGYGTFLLLAIVSSVAVCLYRARKMKLSNDIVWSLAPWLVVGGILGGRAFYVILNWQDYASNSIGESLGKILAFQSGGLVVYGALIGGLIGGAVFCMRNRESFLQLGDMVAPGLFLGVALGRIGCLMNGCCWGGRCEEHWSALHFPHGSPVYENQLRSGELVGLKIPHLDQSSGVGVIEDVAPQSLAELAGFKPGERVRISLQDERLRTREPQRDDHPKLMAVVESIEPSTNKKRALWTADRLPERALPVYPAQIISFISGLSICVMLLTIADRVSPPGMLLSIGFATYAVLRFFEEIVREDEPGRFGTSLSISQWVSIVSFLSFGALMIWLRGRGSRLER